MSEGALAVPEKLDKDTYTLLAYTRWMQNYGESFYFTKELHYGPNKSREIKNKDKIILIKINIFLILIFSPKLFFTS